jgi:hypothetical protein
MKARMIAQTRSVVLLCAVAPRRCSPLLSIVSGSWCLHRMRGGQCIMGRKICKHVLTPAKAQQSGAGMF